MHQANDIRCTSLRADPVWADADLLSESNSPVEETVCCRERVGGYREVGVGLVIAV